MMTTAKIVSTAHGPEVSLVTALGTEIERFTVGEFEQFVAALSVIARTARGQMSARARMSNLPMRG